MSASSSGTDKEAAVGVVTGVRIPAGPPLTSSSKSSGQVTDGAGSGGRLPTRMFPAAAPSKTPLPHVQHLCRIPVNFVKCYDQRFLLKAAREDQPELFVDLETPRPDFQEQNGAELHLGVSGQFRLEARRNSAVKPHLDIYIPISEVAKLREALGRLQL